MEKITRQELPEFYNKAKYGVVYSDNPNAITVPVNLTEERAGKFLNDHSVKRVVIYAESGFHFELE